MWRDGAGRAGSSDRAMEMGHLSSDLGAQAGFSAIQDMGARMEAMGRQEMSAVEGEGFLGGAACGLGLVAAFAAVVSPDPLSKVSLLTYGGTALGCISAF